MVRGVSSQKPWDCVLGALEKDASTKENRQVGGKMWISFVDMLFAHRLVLPRSGGRDFGAT